MGGEDDPWSKDGSRNKLAFWFLEVLALCCDKHQAVYLNASLLLKENRTTQAGQSKKHFGGKHVKSFAKCSHTSISHPQTEISHWNLLSNTLLELSCTSNLKYGTTESEAPSKINLATRYWKVILWQRCKLSSSHKSLIKHDFRD